METKGIVIMPSKTDKVKIGNPLLDRRVKLTPDQRKEIYEQFHTHGRGLRDIAREYGVNHKTISFIVHPERYTADKESRKGTWRKFYDRSRHTQAMRGHRQYKRELDKKGLL